MEKELITYMLNEFREHDLYYYGNENTKYNNLMLNINNLKTLEAENNCKIFTSLKNIISSPLDLNEDTDIQSDELTKLCFNVFRRNGYRREESCKHLEFKKDTLPFFFFMLKDYIRPTREKSLNKIMIGLPTLLKKEWIDSLIYLNILENLNKIYLPELKSLVIHLVLNLNEEELFEELLRSNNFKKKQILIELIFKLDSHKKYFFENLEKYLSNEKDFIVRKIILKKLIEMNYENILEFFINDPSSSNRKKLIEYLIYSKKENRETINPILKKMIFDKSSTVRSYVRFYLKDENINFLYEYISHIGINLKISILEIGECGSENEIPFLKTFLNHEDKIISKNAIISICRIEPTCINEFIDKLLSEDEITFHTIIKIMKKNNNFKREKLIEIYKSLEDEKRKSKCSDLLLNMKMWESVINLLELLNFESNNKIRKNLLNKFDKLKEKLSRYYWINPTSSEIESIYKLEEIDGVEKIFEYLNFALNKKSTVNKPKFNKFKINMETGTKYDKDGYDISGDNKYGYDAKGFDKFGFDKFDIHKKTGNMFDEGGYNSFGYNIDGYDRNNFNRYNIHKKTKTKYDENGYDIDGYNIKKHNRAGFLRDGYHIVTKRDIDGYDRDGYTSTDNMDEFDDLINGRTENEKNEEELEENPRIVSSSLDIDSGIEKEIEISMQKYGLDRQGYFENGFNIFGIHRITATYFNEYG